MPRMEANKEQQSPGLYIPDLQGGARYLTASTLAKDCIVRGCCTARSAPSFVHEVTAQMQIEDL